VLRQSDKDVATVVGAGVTLFEALKAHDLLAKDGIAIRVVDAYSIQPIDRAGLIAAGKASGGWILTVEDHYAQGGLGDAVSEAVWDQGFTVQRLAVREIPRSGEPDELLDRYGISAGAIAKAVKARTKH
jgi:transketolase